MPTSADVPPRFDIVSVRAAHPDVGTVLYWRSTGDGFTAITTVQNLIQRAWNLTLESQTVNLPGWARSDLFEVAAKMDPDTYAGFRKLAGDEQERQWRGMIQTILADRFRMVAHSESRPMPVYALVAAKGGTRLRPSNSHEEAGWSTGHGRITGRAMEMPNLADRLSDALSRMVVDQTGLTGAYDISLTWTPDDERGPADSGPSLFTAIDEQLGLRLEFTRAPVPVLVIDRIEKPSPN